VLNQFYLVIILTVGIFNNIKKERENPTLFTMKHFDPSQHYFLILLTAVFLKPFVTMPTLTADPAMLTHTTG